MQNLSIQDKFNEIADDYDTKTIYFGDFINDILYDKTQAGQSFTLNYDATLSDEVLPVFTGVYEAIYDYITSADCTYIDMGLLLEDINDENNAQTLANYEFSVTYRGSELAYNGLSAADFA